MTATPIMSRDEERFMAFEGLVQWTHAVVAQAAACRKPKGIWPLLIPLHAGLRRAASIPSATTSPLQRTSCWSSRSGRCRSGCARTSISVRLMLSRDGTSRTFATCASTCWTISREKVAIRGGGEPKQLSTKRTQAHSSELSSAGGLTGSRLVGRLNGFCHGFLPNLSRIRRGRTCRLHQSRLLLCACSHALTS